MWICHEAWTRSHCWLSTLARDMFVVRRDNPHTTSRMWVQLRRFLVRRSLHFFLFLYITFVALFSLFHSLRPFRQSPRDIDHTSYRVSNDMVTTCDIHPDTHEYRDTLIYSIPPQSLWRRLTQLDSTHSKVSRITLNSTILLNLLQLFIKLWSLLSQFTWHTQQSRQTHDLRWIMIANMI